MRQLKNHEWYLVLAILILIVYGRTLFDPLLWWDDRQHICQNPLFLDLSWKRLADIWTQPYFGLYAPLAYTFWILPFEVAKSIWSDCLSFGPAFHAENLLLHLLNSFLVFDLLKRLLSTKPTWVAFFGALLFGLHPIQVESVAWVSAQRDLLSAFFGLLALRLFLKDRNGWACICFSLSFFAKASGVIFPFLAVLLLEFGESRGPKKEKIFALTPAVLLSLLIAVLNKYIQADELLHFQIPWWQRPMVFLQALGFYISKFLAPWPLVPAYKRSILDLQNDPSLFWISLWVLPVLILAFKSRKVQWALAWVVIALLPVSGLVSFGFQEISTVADRYFYIPMIGVCLGVCYLLTKARPTPSIILFIALGALSIYQAGFWQDDEVLFHHNVQAEPRSGIAHSNLGNSYFHKKNYSAAESEFLISLKEDPYRAQSWLGLARTYEQTNRPQEAEITYKKSIDLKAALPETYNNLAVIYYTQRNQIEAERNWKMAAQLNPTYFEPRYNLGILFLEQNHSQEARQAFEAALQISPSNPLVIEQLRKFH